MIGKHYYCIRFRFWKEKWFRSHGYLSIRSVGLEMNIDELVDCFFTEFHCILVEFVPNLFIKDTSPKTWRINCQPRESSGDSQRNSAWALVEPGM
jgi:hypothetical protein